jgi:excisionase family DNA binding protein
MVDRGELPGVTKIGRRVRFHRDSLLEWIDGQRTGLD